MSNLDVVGGGASVGGVVSVAGQFRGIGGVGVRNVYVVSDGRPIFSNSGSANTVVYESASRYETGVNSGIPPERQESGAYQTLLPTTPQANGMPHAPYDINYYGPENVRTNSIGGTFLRLQQQIGREGFVEPAYNRESGSGFAYQRTGDFALYGDPNRFVPNPNGTATRVENPRAGQLYTDEVPYHNRERPEYEVARATGAWRFDLGRFGDHRLAGMAERATNRFWTVQRQLLGRDALGKDVLGRVIKGPEIFEVDALLGYSLRLKETWLRAKSLRVQLNVRNLLDNDDIQIIRFNRVGDGYWRVVPREPRNFRLTATLGF